MTEAENSIALKRKVFLSKQMNYDNSLFEVTALKRKRTEHARNRDNPPPHIPPRKDHIIKSNDYITHCGESHDHLLYNDGRGGPSRDDCHELKSNHHHKELLRTIGIDRDSSHQVEPLALSENVRKWDVIKKDFTGKREVKSEYGCRGVKNFKITAHVLPSDFQHGSDFHCVKMRCQSPSPDRNQTVLGNLGVPKEDSRIPAAARLGKVVIKRKYEEDDERTKQAMDLRLGYSNQSTGYGNDDRNIIPNGETFLLNLSCSRNFSRGVAIPSLQGTEATQKHSDYPLLSAKAAQGSERTKRPSSTESCVYEQTKRHSSTEAVVREQTKRHSSTEAVVREQTKRHSSTEAVVREQTKRHSSTEAVVREQTKRHSSTEAVVREQTKRHSSTEAVVREQTKRHLSAKVVVHEQTKRHSSTEAVVREQTKRHSSTKAVVHEQTKRHLSTEAVVREQTKRHLSTEAVVREQTKRHLSTEAIVREQTIRHSEHESCVHELSKRHSSLKYFMHIPTKKHLNHVSRDAIIDMHTRGNCSKDIETNCRHTTVKSVPSKEVSTSSGLCSSDNEVEDLDNMIDEDVGTDLLNVDDLSSDLFDEDITNVECGEKETIKKGIKGQVEDKENEVMKRGGNDEGNVEEKPGIRFIVTLDGVDERQFNSEDGNSVVDSLKCPLVTRQEVTSAIKQLQQKLLLDLVASQAERDTERMLQQVRDLTSAAFVTSVPTPDGAQTFYVSPKEYDNYKEERIFAARQGYLQPAAAIEEETEASALKRARMSERCKFWPACALGSSCEYHHPTTQCKLFPNCKFGDKCLFIHPNCRFNAKCTRLDCRYTHTSRRPSLVSAARVITIPPPHFSFAPVLHKPHKMGSTYHSLQTLCRYFPNCQNMICPFVHPKPCRFGSACNTRSCLFYHSTVPRKGKLKWQACRNKQKTNAPVVQYTIKMEQNVPGIPIRPQSSHGASVSSSSQF